MKVQHYCPAHPKGPRWVKGPVKDCKHHRKVSKRRRVPGAEAGNE